MTLRRHHRHLAEGQRAMVAAQLANMRREDTLKQGTRSANVQNGAVSQAQAARLLQVSERSVTEAAKVRREARPEVVAGASPAPRRAQVRYLAQSPRQGVRSGEGSLP